MTPDETKPYHLSVPQIPRCLQTDDIMRGLKSFADSQNYINFRTAAHIFIWAPWGGCSIFGKFRAAVMMQLRFDGTFGFPGGLINRHEDILDGLNRELTEEIGWDVSKHKVTWGHYYNTRVDEVKKAVFHFFIVELSLADFEDLEKRGHNAKDYGSEVFGSVRVPLYTMSNNISGFPAFLNHRFVDIAKQQLFLALYETKIFNESEIEAVMFKSKAIRQNSPQF